MADLKKREFNALELTGNNFIQWASDVKLYLKGKSLLYTIIELNLTDKGKGIERDPIKIEEDKAKAASILRHHLTDSLKHEYTNYEDPKLLWEELNERFGHNKSVLLPKAIDEWRELRFQDFKSISDYNSALHLIKSKLVYCGQIITDEEMIEKTLSTFHVNSILLQQQYRERHFKKYHELLKTLLVAEQNNELLLKNHNRRPVGTMPFNETNMIERNVRHRGRGNYFIRGRGRGKYHEKSGMNTFEQGNFYGRSHGRGRGHGLSRGRGRSNVYERNMFPPPK